jgi:hypothetical protein
VFIFVSFRFDSTTIPWPRLPPTDATYLRTTEQRTEKVDSSIVLRKRIVYTVVMIVGITSSTLVVMVAIVGFHFLPTGSP